MPELAPEPRRPSGRRFELPLTAKRALTACHVVGGCVWLAYMVFALVLCVWVRASDDPSSAEAAWKVLSFFNGLGVGAVSFLVLGSGIVLGATGRWGVVHHWWTAAKFAATCAVIVGGLLVLRPSVIALGEGSGGDGTQWALTAGTVFGAALLGFAVVVSYVRPWGPIRAGAVQPMDDGRFDVRVRRAVPIAERVHSIELVGLRGRLLPPFEAGAHVEIELPSGLVRQYSLASDAADRLAYRIAVLREDAGRGGSREAHRLRPGDMVRISKPRNMFALGLHPGYLFVAGGIGITPIRSMIAQVERARMPWRLVYTGRDRAAMAFADQLATTWPGNVVLYPTATHGRVNLVAEVAGLPSGTGVYACGPDSLIGALAATIATAAPHLELHTERFTAGSGPREPFEIVAKRTGAIVAVGAEQNALTALAAAGVEVDFSCEIGVCGTCRLDVIEGRPDNPAQVPAEFGPDGTPRFFPCVARAKGRLVVDA
ncbi:PDR/VanB family oxidoreductase [Glycomyces arizonensis]|uniref:PDR/VanB family oxidoreductase n=1 Tax=Glycomyces arizonensis TaxID=256035 RepID=UPI0004125187|nr:PDR/VanB family oxidoreductase [Glycomyces arizonensis]